MDIDYRDFLPSTSLYDGGTIIRKYQANNQDAPLDFSLKKQLTDEENELSGGPVQFFGRTLTETDPLPFDKNGMLRRPHSDFDPLSLRLHRSMSGSTMSNAVETPYSSTSFGPVSDRTQSKRKSKPLRPHELTKKLIEETVHHPQHPDSVLDGYLMPTRIDSSYSGLSSFRGGWPVLHVNQAMLAGESPSFYHSPPPFLNGLSDRPQFPVRLSSFLGSDLPSVSGLSTTIRGLSPARNGTPERISPSRHGPGMAYKPEKLYPSRNGLSSPKRDTSPIRNGQSSPYRGLSPKRNGLSSPNRGLSPKRNGQSSPNRGLSPKRNGLSSPAEDTSLSCDGPPDKEPENCQSSQDVARNSPNNDGIITSSRKDQSSQDKPNEQASTESVFPSPQDNSKSLLQNLLTVNELSPDSCHFSPDGTCSDQSQSSSPMDQVESSTGIPYAKRKKGNPVPESQKNEAYVLKRMKNNVAAKKSREKRREHEQMLTKKAQELVTANCDLKIVNNSLIQREKKIRMFMSRELEEERNRRIQVENRLKELIRLTKDCRRCSHFLYELKPEH